MPDVTTSATARPDALRFDDRVVIVTGAGRGIGRAHAELLAARGASVVVVDPGGDHLGLGERAEVATEVTAGIHDAGGRAVASTESVASADGAAAIVRLAVETFGRIDAVINNAGIFDSIPFEQLTGDTVRRFLDVHFMGSMYMTSAAWPHLVDCGAGRVVNTVSGAMLGIPEMVHYGSAKGAVWGFTRTLAADGAAVGVKVNAIAPAAATRILAHATSIPADVAERMRTSTTPELVAPLAAYLAHEACAVTGETFSVGGGRVARMGMVSGAGFTDPALTPEGVRARLDEAMDLSGGAPIPPVLTGS